MAEKKRPKLGFRAFLEPNSFDLALAFVCTCDVLDQFTLSRRTETESIQNPSFSQIIARIGLKVRDLISGNNSKVNEEGLDLGNENFQQITDVAITILGTFQDNQPQATLSVATS